MINNDIIGINIVYLKEERTIMKAKEKNPIKVYLIIIMGICYLLGLLEVVFNNGKFYQILGIGFTFFPRYSCCSYKTIDRVQSKVSYFIEGMEKL